MEILRADCCFQRSKKTASQPSGLIVGTTDRNNAKSIMDGESLVAMRALSRSVQFEMTATDRAAWHQDELAVRTRNDLAQGGRQMQDSHPMGVKIAGWWHDGSYCVMAGPGPAIHD